MANRRGANRRDARRNGLRGGGHDGASRERGGKRGQRDARDGQRDSRGGSPRGRSRSRSNKDLSSGLIEGRRAVAEALSAHIPIRHAYVQASIAAEGSLDDLLDQLATAGVPIEEVPASRLEAISSHGAHQGIVVETAPFAYADLSDVIAAAGTGDALVMVLDHVTDEGNFGAIVRSCEVAGASGVVIPKTRAAGVGVGAYKTSAGAVLHLPIAQVPNIAAAIDTLKKAGFWCVAATEHAERSAWEAPLDGRIALVMGSEGSGVSRLVLERVDDACRIPQRGKIESLNVAQAATVLAYEWARRTWGAAEADGGADDGAR